MRLIFIAGAVAFSVASAVAGPVLARSQGDEAGTLKGMRHAAPPSSTSAPKGKSGKSPGLMEDEGIYYKSKPSGTPKSR
jgi:hypothetical protein